jgi:hypothetical protein
MADIPCIFARVSVLFYTCWRGFQRIRLLGNEGGRKTHGKSIMTIIEQIEERSSALKVSEVAKLLEVTRQHIAGEHRYSSFHIPLTGNLNYSGKSSEFSLS